MGRPRRRELGDPGALASECSALRMAAMRTAGPFIDPELAEMHVAAERLFVRGDVTAADVRAVWALVPEHRLERVRGFVNSLTRARQRWSS